MKGFTLIELLITSTIIILFSGSSLVAFLNYQDIRSTNDAADTIVERLRTIQIKATATEVPLECVNGVSNYKVTYGGTSLSVVATCPGVADTAIGNLALSLTGSVFQNSGMITFDSRTISATEVTLRVCGNKKLFTIFVSGSANVSKPVAAGSC